MGGELVLPVDLVRSGVGSGGEAVGVAAQDGLDAFGGLAALAAVRFVDDDGDALAVESGVGGDDRELLQRGDDDLRAAVLERCPKLLGVLVDALQHPPDVVGAGDRRLQLFVEDGPVGEDDDLVEDQLIGLQLPLLRLLCQQRLVRRCVQVGEAVNQPGD